MASPFLTNPLGGLLGARTASFFRLDPTGRVPIEPLIDLVPSFSPNRVVLDMIDNEVSPREYMVTRNALQDFTSASTNVHKELESMTVTGTLVSSIALPLIGSVGLGGIPGFGGGLRLDMLKLAALEALADRREPIMIVTPRKSFPKCFIQSIVPTWTPETGDNTILAVTVVEARIVNPLSAEAVLPDLAGSFTGNNDSTGAGAQSPQAVQTQSITPPAVQGQAPLVVPL